MKVALKPEDERYIREQVGAGRYASAEDALAAAVAQLRQADRAGDFAPGELDALIREAEAEFGRGEGYTMAEMREHFAQRGRQRRRAGGRG